MHESSAYRVNQLLNERRIGSALLVANLLNYSLSPQSRPTRRLSQKSRIGQNVDAVGLAVQNRTTRERYSCAVARQGFGHIFGRSMHQVDWQLLMVATR